MPSLFSRIVAGEIPCHRVYEDDLVIAFLDIMPLSVGHCLVVPKEEREFLHQLSRHSAEALGRALVTVSGAVLAATGATSYNLLQNNGALAHQAVPHVHFHIIPRYDDGTGLGIGWKAGRLDTDTGAKLAATIQSRV
ncbi:MAG: HIT family protein [Phycisphaerales bacterium]|nr:HIT family protein [Phycisphaerales bacterium]